MTSHELTTRRLYQAYGELCHCVDDGISREDARVLRKIRSEVFETYIRFSKGHNYNLSDATKRVTP